MTCALSRGCPVREVSHDLVGHDHLCIGQSCCCLQKPRDLHIGFAHATQWATGQAALAVLPIERLSRGCTVS